MRSKLFLTILLLAAPLLSEGQSLAGRSQRLVGELSEPERVTFVGLKTFTPQAIRSGLLMDPEYLIAAHPAAPLSDYLEILRVKVLEGYRHSGFPDAKVTSRFDEPSARLVVQLEEGPRFKRGEVKVLGPKSISPEALIKRLIERFPPEAAIPSQPHLLQASPQGLTAGFQPANSLDFLGSKRLDSTGKDVQSSPPVWEKGEPAPFDAITLKQITTQITNALGDFGCFFGKVRVNVVPLAEKDIADLHVELLDEGPPGVISKINVRGNKKNSPEDILALTGLVAGQRINRDILTRAELSLWRSARFLRYSVMPKHEADNPLNLAIELEVQEYKDAPPLAKTFSSEEAALLRLRDWLAEAPQRDEDMVVLFSGPVPGYPSSLDLELVISGRDGILVKQSSSPRGSDKKLEYALTLNSERLGLYSAARHRKFVSSISTLQSSAMVSYRPTPPYDEEKPQFTLEIGGGISNVQERERTPFRLDFILAPVAFLDLAHREGIRAAVKDDHLLIEHEMGTIGFDLREKKLAVHNASFLTNGNLSLRVEKGAFDRSRAELDRAVARDKNLAATESPFAGFLGFIALELVQNPFLASIWLKDFTQEPRDRAVVPMQKILDGRILQPLEELFQRWRADADVRFTVPQAIPDDPARAPNAIVAMLSAVIFKFSSDLFPRGSWPWTAAREAVFVASGKDKYTKAELDRLYSSRQTGPIGMLTIGHLLERVNSPLAKSFGIRGLVRLNFEDFYNDCRLLLESDSVITACLSRAVAAAAELSEDEIDALAAIVPADRRPTLIKSLRTLRANRALPLADVLKPVLQEFWEQSLRERTRSALKEIAFGRKQQK